MFASVSYFGRVVSDMSNQNWENTGPYILGIGNYRYADYALTCPMLIADLLCCLRAPYKVTGALTIHAMLLSGVIANFYYGRNWPKGGRGPAIAWFCFSSYWYIVAFIALTHIVKVQYNKLAKIAENTEAKKALLPLRISIVTIFTLWVCYPIIWIIGDQGAGLISFSAVECIHAFCDIVAKSLYGFTLARFKSYYDKKLCTMLDACGYDGEEQLHNVEKRMETDDVELDAMPRNKSPPRSPLASSTRRVYEDDSKEEPLSDTMQQIESLDRQLRTLMASNDSGHRRSMSSDASEAARYRLLCLPRSHPRLFCFFLRYRSASFVTSSDLLVHCRAFGGPACLSELEGLFLMLQPMVPLVPPP